MNPRQMSVENIGSGSLHVYEHEFGAKTAAKARVVGANESCLFAIRDGVHLVITNGTPLTVPLGAAAQAPLTTDDLIRRIRGAIDGQVHQHMAASELRDLAAATLTLAETECVGLHGNTPVTGAALMAGANPTIGEAMHSERRIGVKEVLYFMAADGFLTGLQCDEWLKSLNGARAEQGKPEY